MRSSGSGAGEPAASRISISSSTGTSARSANWAKVKPLSAEKRSKAGASRKSSETLPLRTAAPSPSGGMPTAMMLLHHADAAHVPRREPIIRTRSDDSQGNELAQLIDADTTAS